MKSVCQVLGVARSNLHLLSRRAMEWQDGSRGRTPLQDEAVLADIRRHIADLPSYGYRRGGALVNRERRTHGLPVLNPSASI